jgi:tRNA1(Val) A37 N6-methylase TrmN6
MQPSDFAGTADAVLMNPPYAGARWKDHFEHAIGFVRNGGMVAAILPEGAVNKMREIGGFEVVYSPVKHNRFSDTTIGVVFAKVTVGVKGNTRGAAQRRAGADSEQFGLFEAA